MLPFLLSAALLGPIVVAANGSCSGADPAIVGAAVKSMTRDGALNHYVVDITVTNRGSAGQPGNTLQSVEVFQDATKVDQKGLPPLKPGQTAVVEYRFVRSHLAEHNSTRLRFQIQAQGSAGATGAGCSTDDQTSRLSV
jgi:hypothetical protein